MSTDLFLQLCTTTPLVHIHTHPHYSSTAATATKARVELHYNTPSHFQHAVAAAAVVVQCSDIEAVVCSCRQGEPGERFGTFFAWL
jgi:hypothetical protein